MASTTIRISQGAWDEARKLARETGQPISRVVEAAIKAERRRLFWARARAAVEATRADARASAEEAADLALYACTVMDGLEDELAPE